MSADTARIIFVPFIDAFGGVERLVLGLSRYLHQRRKRHQVVCFRDTIGLPAYAEWKLRVEQLRPRRHPVSEAASIGKFLRKSLNAGALPPLIFDLRGAFYSALFCPRGYTLHLTDPPSLLPTDESKNAFSVRWQKGSPTLAEPKGVGALAQLWASGRSEAIHRINTRGVQKAASVIVMTDAIAAEVQGLYSVKPEVVRPGVMQNSTARPLISRRPGEPIRLLSVSRLEANKRIDWILSSLARLQYEAAGAAESWRLDVVGVGVEKANLQSMAEQLRITDRVLFHGLVPDEDLRQLYASADLFLMPAVQGYGLPALEALSAGVPVILHRESGVAELLRETAWVEILDDMGDSLAGALRTMFRRIRENYLFEELPPAIPLEQDWSAKVCRLAQWT